MSWKGWLAGGAAVIALPSMMMESKEPGSSLEYRSSVNESLHGVTETFAINAQDIVTQGTPVVQSLADSLKANLAALAPVAPAAPAAGAGTGPSLPAPVMVNP